MINIPGQNLRNNLLHKIRVLVETVLFTIVLFLCVEGSLIVFNIGNNKVDNVSRALLFKMGAPLKPVDPTIFGKYEKDGLLFWKPMLA